MKYIIGVLAVVMVLVAVFCADFSSTSNLIQTSDFLRIHIRANSNSEADQNVKYEIKDSIVQYLTPIVCEINSKEELMQVVEENSSQIKVIADNILRSYGFSYKATVKLDNENFPTRTYNGYTLESGFYDAIIVELGNAIGDNWWCVVYPPLCFLNYQPNNSGTVVYKSKIWEIINQFFN